jgi:hypothetical protein
MKRRPPQKQIKKVINVNENDFSPKKQTNQGNHQEQRSTKGINKLDQPRTKINKGDQQTRSTKNRDQPTIPNNVQFNKNISAT